MHDTVRLEEQGIPAVAIATHVFRGAAGAQASQLGRPDMTVLFVPHPIQDQTTQEIEAKADSIIESIAMALLKNTD